MDRDMMKAYVEAAAAALDLPIAAEHMPGVLINFERLAGIAGLLDEFVLEVADEAGPVWRP